jgi:hypothetical protein
LDGNAGFFAGAAPSLDDLVYASSRKASPVTMTKYFYSIEIPNGTAAGGRRPSSRTSSIQSPQAFETRGS